MKFKLGFSARHKTENLDRLVLYQWDARDVSAPVWSQAISINEGQYWEWNWVMQLTRAAATNLQSLIFEQLQ